MRTIIAGSRFISTYQDLIDAIESAPFVPSAIIGGSTRRVDELSERYAAEHNLTLCRFTLDTKNYGDKARKMRNKAMVEVAQALIVLFSGMNRDTECITAEARAANLLVHIWPIKALTPPDRDNFTIDF